VCGGGNGCWSVCSRVRKEAGSAMDGFRWVLKFIQEDHKGSS
jgi:hypothetical protein